MSDTPRTDERDTSLREVTGWDSPAYNHLLFFTNKLEKELAAERERANRIARSAWVSAIVLAHNICVQENDSINSNDGSVEAMDALSEAARRIREWAEPTDEQISQLLAESVVAIDAARRK